MFLYASPVRSITVGTVMLRALDRVRGRVLGLLGSGSPKSRRFIAKKSALGLDFADSSPIGLQICIRNYGGCLSVPSTSSARSLPLQSHSQRPRCPCAAHALPKGATLDAQHGGPSRSVQNALKFETHAPKRRTPPCPLQATNPIASVTAPLPRRSTLAPSTCRGKVERVRHR